ncbi:MAG TPA: hypothetical protein VLE53_08675 [Gemmatimonadaceae bacterium]|nr:hypothetical protein [Gemmatimonadaceae bacterium]
MAPFERTAGPTRYLLGRVAADWVMRSIQRAGGGEVIDPKH